MGDYIDPFGVATVAQGSGGKRKRVHVDDEDNAYAKTIYVRPSAKYPRKDLFVTSSAERNILSFGADNTGATDTSPILEQALTDLLISGVGNGTVYFPPGTYRFESTVSIPVNTKIMGDHYGAVFMNFYDNTAGTQMFRFSTSPNPNNDIALVDLFLDYQGTATDAVAVSDNGRSTINYHLDKLQVIGFATMFEASGSLTSGVIENCFADTTDTSIVLTGGRHTISQNLWAGGDGGSNTETAVATSGTAIATIVSNRNTRVANPLYSIGVAGSSVIGNLRDSTADVALGGASAAATTYVGFIDKATQRLTFGGDVPGPYADDTAAAAGGVPIGGLYHNSGVVQVRLV